MLWPIVYCSSHFGVCLGGSITTDITDMWINEVDMLMAVQKSAVSCSENPRKEADMTGVVINCTVCFGHNLVHSGNLQFNSSQTGCKVRWSDDWCKISERRPK